MAAGGTGEARPCAARLREVWLAGGTRSALTSWRPCHEWRLRRFRFRSLHRAACQQRFVELWQDIAGKYKNSPVIWGYDLANEPVESMGSADLLDWQELAERTAQAIRAIDPQRTIIVEPAMWGSPEGLLAFEPLNVPHVVYSVHMYIPHEFTHQNVHGVTTPKVYPGEINGRVWDKRQLEEALQPAIDFQQTYNVPMYIGEFSAIRWAPDNSATVTSRT